jgi:hypothetical protein
LLSPCFKDLAATVHGRGVALILGRGARLRSSSLFFQE